MNLIAAQPLLRRETNAEIPQIFGSRFVKHRGSTELCWGGSDCADAAVEQACSCCMLVRPLMHASPAAEKKNGGVAASVF
jgi:hypothetical protein